MTPQFINATHFKNFWQKGTGKELLNWSQTDLDEATFQRYAPLFHQIDELGDAAVTETYLKLPYPEASALIAKYCSGETDNEPGCDSLNQLFGQINHAPDWFDEKLANCGAALCMRSGANSLMILRDFSLMGGYDFAYLNKPLIHTQAFKRGAVKRLKDTLEFWISVTRTDALRPQSKAFELIVRTRLMHSYARLKIKKDDQHWDYENWGEPINLWDMIATYTGFSLVFMQGLRKLGIHISENEECGLFHLWKYVGYLLGIPADFLPDTRKQAVGQFYWWTTTQEKGDLDSAELALALRNENLENTIYKQMFRRRTLLRLHDSMNWFLLDTEILHRLDIPQPPPLYRVFPKFILLANRFSQKIYTLSNPEKYARLVQFGNDQQQKVLADYVKHSK